MYKILIIEDDLVMAGAIKKEMEAWGNEARYVEDFAKVLETFAEYWSTSGAFGYHASFL